MTTYIFRKNIEAGQGEPFPAGQKVIILTKERGKGAFLAEIRMDRAWNVGYYNLWKRTDKNGESEKIWPRKKRNRLSPACSRAPAGASASWRLRTERAGRTTILSRPEPPAEPGTGTRSRPPPTRRPPGRRGGAPPRWCGCWSGPTSLSPARWKSWAGNCGSGPTRTSCRGPSKSPARPRACGPGRRPPWRCWGTAPPRRPPWAPCGRPSALRGTGNPPPPPFSITMK